MFHVAQLEQRLKEDIGDASIRVVSLPTRHQIVCRELDEDLVRRLTERYAPSEPVEIVAL